MAVAAAALSTDSAPKSPTERLPVAETLEKAAKKLEAYAQKLNAHAAEIREQAAVEQAPIPDELAKALGDTVKTATCVGESKKLSLRDPNRAKMPSSFVKTVNGTGPGFLVLCTSVEKVPTTKIVAVFQQFRDKARWWLQTGNLFASQLEWNDYYGYQPRTLETADYQKFADLVTGKDVADESGVVWRKV